MLSFGIGQAVRRAEDKRFLTGAGNYVDDITLPHQCYGALMLSTHAHALIKRVDISAASAAPGVLTILLGSQASGEGVGGIPPHFMPEDWGGPKGFATLRPPLIVDRVRCIGDRIAFVVAETECQARDAAELVEIEYEDLPAVCNVEAASRPGAPTLWEECPTGNVAATIAFGDKFATEEAFSRAAYVASVRLENNRIAASAMEPRCAIGDYHRSDESYTLYTSSQDPHGLRTALARSVFRIPETRVRVVAPDVGGGFGMKGNLYPDEVLVLWASRRVGRPVKWVATRQESLLLDTQSRDQVIDGDMALDSDGRILAVRARARLSLGAYWSAAITAPLFFSLMLIPNVYDVQTVHLTSEAVFTNAAPTSVYRGAGRPEAIYFMERLIERAARVSGIDRVELRRRNLLSPMALPHETPTHLTYDSGEFERLMDRCLHLADWSGFEARRLESERNGMLRGRAVTPFIELAGVFNDRMELRFDPSGAVTIISGLHSHGQGHATAFAQLVSDWLGVPFESINYVQGDTREVTFGRGTFAARSSMVGGCALRAAADTILVRAKLMAASLLEASADDIEFGKGVFQVAGTDRTILLTEVAKAFFSSTGPVLSLGLGLDAAGSYSGAPGAAPNFPNGCHVCEVEIDPETGALTIERYVTVDDLGMVINPMICEGQIHGGLAQGIGQAVSEQIVYDDAGQLLTGTFMDYGMPRADSLPSIVSELVEVPSTTNPLGIKGIAESGTIAAPPTVVNAALDALRPLGVEHVDMPLSPSRIWSAIRSAGN